MGLATEQVYSLWRDKMEKATHHRDWSRPETWPKP